jgi:hypothetical protein
MSPAQPYGPCGLMGRSDPSHWHNDLWQPYNSVLLQLSIHHKSDKLYLKWMLKHYLTFPFHLKTQSCNQNWRDLFVFAHFFCEFWESLEFKLPYFGFSFINLIKFLVGQSEWKTSLKKYGMRSAMYRFSG